MNFTYILQCADGSLYTGWTNHLEERVRTHNSTSGAKYTRARRPATLVYFEGFPTKEDAMKRESAIKKLTHGQKMKLLSLQETLDQ